jgi:hypothetical protein
MNNFAVCLLSIFKYNTNEGLVDEKELKNGLIAYMI